MSPVNHSPQPGRATPAIEDTPSPVTLRERSDTVIPLTPLPVTTTPAKKQQNDPTLAELLILLSDALSDVHSIKTTTTSSNHWSGGSLLVNSVNSVNSALFRKNSAEF